jgi:lipoprotein-releasing system permease protein
MISWISVGAIAVTTGALIVILSAMNGLTSTVADLYNAFEPDLKVTASRGKYFTADESFLRKIRSVEGVKLISMTLSDKALIKNGDFQSLVSVKGVDKNFNQLTKIDLSIVSGAYTLNDFKRQSIILGRGVANQLQVNINEFSNELSLFSPVRGKEVGLNPMDNMNHVYCSPSGIFSLNDDLDYQFVFVSIETAKKLFDIPDKISALEISCEKNQNEDVQKILQQKLGSDFIVKNRYQLNDTLFKSLETEKLATFIILAFILVIATFNIIGALTMLIIEKKKDIKTLYSMGAGITLIRNIFMREGLLITGIGAIIGLLLGLVVCWIQIQFHLVKFGDDFIIPYYPIVLQLKDFLWIFGLIMLIGFLAALYPVRVFTKMDLVH